MARKLYVFGIGGTGSRVIKAMAMLFAAGCHLKNDFDTVVPIIIDPDIANGDLNRTKHILGNYQEIRNQVHQPDDFFLQKVKTIQELADNNSVINPEYFQFKLDEVDINTFNQYIGFDSLQRDAQNEADDKSFLKLLYSDQNISSDLKVGFKGNPNIGSVVLNQFTHSDHFRRFAETFNQGDAVFIVNSIFGGTGAAGFPLLLKNLRGNADLPNSALISQALIGGVTFLPYFSLDKQDEVKSQSFAEKAKIAISYYNRTIIHKNQVNTLYFIGNEGSSNILKYAVGGESQKNKAHFLEMAGAMAIFDFCENVGEQANPTTIKEFGIERDSRAISFNDLNIDHSKLIGIPLSKYYLFTQYLEKGLPKALNVSRWTKSNIKLVKRSRNSILDERYFASKEYSNQIESFNRYFVEWITEMDNNEPAFSPFKLGESGHGLDLFTNDCYHGKQKFNALDRKNCEWIDKTDIGPSAETKHTALIKLFGKTTGQLLAGKL